MFYKRKLCFSLNHNLQSQFTILVKAGLSCDRSFIVLVTIIMIVNYDRETFIVQATRVNVTLFFFVVDAESK